MVKTTILTFVIVLLLPAFAMESEELAPIALSLMDKSVDDMYFNCSEAMAKRVETEYFTRELKEQPFKDGWKIAASFAKTKYEKRKNKALTKNEIQAIFVYTQQYPNVYDPLNTEVRDGAAKYSTPEFPFHALHFWLTSAVQILSANKPCRITYRRSKIMFSGQVHQEMRFGYFASSSKRSDLTVFGHVTCFHIKTCYGASIKKYSKIDEQEVLVPPYEKFRIIEIVKGPYEELKDCKTVFVLESTGIMSNLNCKVARSVP